MRLIIVRSEKKIKASDVKQVADTVGSSGQLVLSGEGLIITPNEKYFKQNETGKNYSIKPYTKGGRSFDRGRPYSSSKRLVAGAA
jgi:hypothetical protein